MKRITTIILGVLFLVACNDEKLGINTSNNYQDTEGIKVNLTIARSDVTDTKATVKTSFADNDVVYIFFKGIAAPKYLEMKYNSSESTWTATAQNELTASDLSGVADKRMTAIYLPYGSDATVVADDGAFIFQNGTGNPLNYTGYYLQAEQVAYTYEADVLSGSISLIACALDDNDDRYIHFDISGFTSGHSYKLYQDYVKPLSFTSILADGSVSKSEGSLGEAVIGYEDGSMMSFSGILDASAVGKDVDYQFTIDDLTSSILYTRDAGTKTLSASKYIGIGTINDSGTWNAIEYVDLGLSSIWAKCNLGALTETEYGDYYAWGEHEPYYDTGYAQEIPQTHWKSGKEDGYTWTSYCWANGVYDRLTKYCTTLSCGAYTPYGTTFIDHKSVVEIDDDACSIKLKGKWRYPFFDEILNNNYCDWIWYNDYNSSGVCGYEVISKISGYEGNKIFLPAAGTYHDSNLYDLDSYGMYWAGKIKASDPWLACGLQFIGNRGEIHEFNYINRCQGLSLRPTCRLYILKLSLINESITITEGDDYTIIAQNGIEVVNHLITWVSDNPSIATVNENGVVRGVSEGNATITAFFRNKTATCTVVVKKRPEDVYVDLGLSVKWAFCNVGASAPEEYGDYFAWGETEPYYEPGYAQEYPQTHWKDGISGYNWSSYKYCVGSNDNITKYCNNSSYGYNGFKDNKFTLDLEDDAAHVNWGGSWRLPTKTEINELLNSTNCTWTLTSLNGVNGYLVTSKKTGYEGASIFLPAAGWYGGNHRSNVGDNGYYWSSTLYEVFAGCVYNLYFDSDYHAVSAPSRCNGLPVRAVSP